VTIVVSAPAKLVLAGEYVVLDGAPALVTAVNRRVRVTLSASDMWTLTSDAVPGHAHALLADVPSPALGGRLVPNALLQILGPDWSAHPPMRVHIESAALRDPGAGVSMGLGSSAAVVVALTGALRQLAGAPPDDGAAFALSRALHHQWQGDLGSGIDIAAAHHGGTLLFQRDPDGGDEPRVAALPRPRGLEWQAWFTGKKVSTRSFVSTLRAARSDDPAGYERQMGALGEAAAAVTATWQSGRLPELLAAVRRHHDAMAALGHWAELPIVSRTHAELAALAARVDAAYKPSGAGGGDVGIAFAAHPATLSLLEDLARPAGYRPLALAVDPRGVSLE
jgi:phosphomevalonate kinase